MNKQLSTETLELIEEKGFHLAEDGNYYNTTKKVKICINHIISKNKYYPLVMSEGSVCDFVQRGIFDSYEDALKKGIMDTTIY